MPPEFESIIESSYGRIRYIARQYAGSAAAEDLTQEILLQLWRSYKDYRGGAKVETWIYQVAINTAVT